MSNRDSRDKEASTNSIIFTGKKVDDWFRFDRQVTRWIRKTYGDYGIKLWNETAIAIDANSVGSIANDTYESLIESETQKDADYYYSWDYFWTVEYQQKWRAKTLIRIRDYVEGRTEGKAFIYMHGRINRGAVTYDEI